MNPTDYKYVTLSEAAARRRAETWNILRVGGASLICSPVASDKALNTSERMPVRVYGVRVRRSVRGQALLLNLFHHPTGLPVRFRRRHTSVRINPRNEKRRARA